MPVDSAIIYTPGGQIAMIVHVDDEPDDVAEAKITTDPAFNPDGLIQTRMPRDVYDACAAGTVEDSYYNIMAQTVAILNASPAMGKVTMGKPLSPVQSLAASIQAKLDTIDAQRQADADAQAVAAAAFQATVMAYEVQTGAKYDPEDTADFEAWLLKQAPADVQAEAADAAPAGNDIAP